MMHKLNKHLSNIRYGHISHFLIPSIHQKLLYYTGVDILHTGKQPVSFLRPITYMQIICTIVFTRLYYSHVGEMFQKHVLFPS